MLYTKLRFGIILFFVALGVLLHVQLGFGSAWYLYLAAFVLLISFFLFGNVWLAFRLLKQGKPDKADELLNLIPRPDWLMRRNQAYFYFTKGMILLQRKELAPSAYHLEKALELGLQSQNDKALASLNLAHINYVQQNMDKAKYYMKLAQECKSEDLMIKEHLKKLEEVL